MYQHISLDLSWLGLCKSKIRFKKWTYEFTHTSWTYFVRNHIQTFFSWMPIANHGDLQRMVSYCEAYIIKDQISSNELIKKRKPACMLRIA